MYNVDSIGLDASLQAADKAITYREGEKPKFHGTLKLVFLQVPLVDAFEFGLHAKSFFNFKHVCSNTCRDIIICIVSEQKVV